MSERKKKESLTLKIGGMHCANCALTVEKALREIEGVEQADVSFATEKAFVTLDPSVAEISDLEHAVEGTGYRVAREKVRLKVSGLADASDARGVERTLSSMEGVKRASVDHISGYASVEYNSALISLADISRTLDSLGFRVVGEEFAVSVEQREAKRLKRLAALGMALTIPVMIYSHGSMLLREYVTFLPLLGQPASAYLLFVLSSVVQVLIGGRFYLGAIRAARMRTANMDTLVALGTTAAFLLSVRYTFPTPNWDYIYYDSSVAVLSFVLLGKYFEAKMKGRTSAVVKRILELRPKRARVIRDGSELEISVEAIKPGDLMVVRPGERVPTDGLVVGGRSAVDESMVTGESIPVEKKAGEEVIGGSVNREGSLKVEATKVGADTFISQVAKLVEDALGRKPPIQRIVDRVAGYFTFGVISVALLTFALWYLLVGVEFARALLYTVAVLVVACPCALGLATPTAITVGMGKGAEYGIFIKNGDAIETASKLDLLVFDKTGTLTRGEPQVVDWAVVRPIIAMNPTSNRTGRTSEELLLSLAATAEKNSEHPLAEAIVRRAEEAGVEIAEPVDFISIPGKGVRAKYDDMNLLVGSVKLMAEKGVEMNGAEEVADKMMEDGKTVVGVAVDGRIFGLLGLMDTPRKEALGALSALKHMGLEVTMITGDNERTAKAIAKQLEIGEVLANVLPGDKATEIAELQERGKVVGMIGDGVNDAPALTQADVGFAIGSGTDIAIEAGDVVLVRDDLNDVVASVQLSKRTVRQVMQNLGWAFLYNTVLIPVAALGRLYPVYAGIAMALSSISVTSWSLLMKRYVPEVKRT